MDSVKWLCGLLCICLVAAGCSAAVTEPLDLEALVVEPRFAILPAIGDSATLSALRRDADGESYCPDVSWLSQDNHVVTVTSKGKVIAKGIGVATIVATCANLQASATVQVGAELRAFPEAEGWGAGALSSCRRVGTQVLTVSSLNDAGPGSLRAALEQAKNDVLSVIVFRVGGYLDLQQDIELRDKSCLYIAGQTAPGDGITIRRPLGRAFFVKGDSHNMVIRHLRFRGGWGGDNRGHILIQIGSGHDIILDHLSLSWTSDKALSITKETMAWSQPIRRISVQRSILSEVFAVHSTGAQISGEDNDGMTEWQNLKEISIHRNLFAHNSHRNPNVTTAGTEVINNLVYNWRQGALQATRGSRLDVVANYFQPGPMTDSRYLYEVTWNCENHEGFEPSLHLEGNIGPHNDDPSAGNWDGESRMAACYYTTGSTVGEELPEHFRRTKPLSAAAWPVQVLPATTARDDVLANVGATAGLACEGGWIRRFDAVDRRVLENVRQGSGPDHPPENEDGVGGFPVLSGGDACPDADSDALPDAFERRFGLDPDDSSDAGIDSDGDGYTNIEEYLNASSP